MYHYIDLLIEFALSMRWIWLVVVILVYRLLKIVAVGWANKLSMESDVILRDTQYKEDDIVGHLDYIIKEALEEYQLSYLIPKDIPYINNKEEQKILNYLADEIPGRISKVLYTHLAFIYNDEYIGKFIGRHISMSVTDFVLNFNIGNYDDGEKNNTS